MMFQFVQPHPHAYPTWTIHVHRGGNWVDFPLLCIYCLWSNSYCFVRSFPPPTKEGSWTNCPLEFRPKPLLSIGRNECVQLNSQSKLTCWWIEAVETWMYVCLYVCVHSFGQAKQNRTWMHNMVIVKTNHNSILFRLAHDHHFIKFKLTNEVAPFIHCSIPKMPDSQVSIVRLS